MANIITLVRIVISVIMLFLPALSPTFFLLYITAGITDIADGAVARRTGTAGKRGSKLDTVADTVFTAVCMIKLLPVMRIPTGIYIWIAVIAAIKVMNIAEGYIRRKELVAVHSAMNRVTGVILYFFPMTPAFINVRYSAVFVCAVATLAAIVERYLIKRGKIN